MGIPGLGFLRGKKTFDSLDELVQHDIGNGHTSKKPGTITISQKGNPIRTLKIKSSSDSIDYFLEPRMVFTPADSDFETVELSGFRHVGFASPSSIGETLKYATLMKDTQFKEFYYAHFELFFYELIKEYKYLRTCLSDQNVEPDQMADEKIESALKVIGKHRGLITPAYDVQDALRAGYGKRLPDRGRTGGPKTEGISPITPSLEIVQDMGNGNVRRFQTIDQLANYLNALAKHESLSLRTGLVKSSTVEHDAENQYTFGVELETEIDLSNLPPIKIRRREAIGFWRYEEPYEFNARPADTIVAARYAELAHTYAKLIHYDTAQQIGVALSMQSPSLRSSFLPPQRLRDYNDPIFQSIQRNSGLYIPTIAFQNIAVPGHPRHNKN